MTEREWKALAQWLNGTWLRGLACCLATVALCLGAIHSLATVEQRSNDRDVEMTGERAVWKEFAGERWRSYEPAPEAKPDGAVGIKRDEWGDDVWDIRAAVPWDIIGTYLLIAGSFFLLPLANGSVLVARSGAGWAGRHAADIASGRRKLEREQEKVAARDRLIAELEAGETGLDIALREVQDAQDKIRAAQAPDPQDRKDPRRARPRRLRRRHAA